MKVIAVETLRLREHADFVWVLVHTDEGITGTGETMPRVDAVERIVHEVLAPLLLDRDPAPEPFWHRAFQALAYHGFAGAEFRALSALDIALWDVLGQQAGLPVHRLLGGPCRERVPVYNTCVSRGDVRDHERFLDDPGGLARELVAAGYPAMKIWPFDELSVATMGQRISRTQLDVGRRYFARIREVVGDDIEVALEGHSCWNLPSAIAIARALEEFEPMWLEDLVQATDVETWRQLRESTAIPICGSERLFSRHQVQPYLDAGVFDVVKQDVCWTGGLTEFVKIAAAADTRQRPVAPHNCHGPVGATATLHASATVSNLYLMESVRAFATGFFGELVDDPPVIRDGSMAVPQRPGLGVALRDDVVARARRVRTDNTSSTRSAWTQGDPWSEKSGDRP